jgi:ATP-binding cassette subfamily B protein RaxB
VLQDDNLFAGSLADNIALYDDAPDGDRMEAAAKAAAIHDDIAAMPMEYETLVGDMGSTLSGGQRQRVLLARALYRQAKLLVIDEGTSFVDASREASIHESVGEMKATRIVVAHDKQTISLADRAYEMSNGRPVASFPEEDPAAPLHLLSGAPE